MSAQGASSVQVPQPVVCAELEIFGATSPRTPCNVHSASAMNSQAARISAESDEASFKERWFIIETASFAELLGPYPLVLDR